MSIDMIPWEIAETAHAIRRAFDRRAAPLGVTRAQWRVLAWLDREPGLRQVELADHLDVEPITLCRIIDRLQESGLVERRRDLEDRRAWRLHLTDTAGPLVNELRALAAMMAGEAFAGLSPEVIDEVRAALAQVRDNLATPAALPKRISA